MQTVHTDIRRPADRPHDPHLNLMRRADAAGQRLFRELVASRIAWATVREVGRLIAVDVVGVSLRTTECDHPAPCLLDGCRPGLAMRAMIGNRTPALPGLRLAAGAGVGGRALSTGRVIAVADYGRESAAARTLLDLTVHEEGIGALACVPVSFAGVVRGMLHVGRRTDEPVGAGPIEALTRVATYAGAALAAAGDRARVEKIAAIRERRRLTRLLHDDFAQRLFSLGVGARVARERAATGHPDLMGQLLRIEQEVGTAAAALRATMRDLDAVETPAGALTATLRDDLADFERRTSIPAHLIVLGESPVDDADAGLLLRAVREGLRNIERHAEAGEVVVTLCADATGLEVSVQDDGLGPRPGSVGTGIGLRELADDLDRVGGGLRLARSDDVGATLRAWLPLR